MSNDDMVIRLCDNLSLFWFLTSQHDQTKATIPIKNMSPRHGIKNMSPRHGKKEYVAETC